MKTTLDVEPGWKTYLKSVIFVLPAMTAMWFTCLCLLPKLKEIWSRADYYNTNAHGIIVVFVGWTEHIFIIGIALAVVLGLLEWRSRVWRRSRRLVAGVVVFLVNTSVIFFMTVMLLNALLTAV
jgi:hypothetical protein